MDEKQYVEFIQSQISEKGIDWYLDNLMSEGFGVIRQGLSDYVLIFPGTDAEVTFNQQELVEFFEFSWLEVPFSDLSIDDLMS